MQITGDMLIGSKSIRGSEGAIRAFNPILNREIEPSFGAGGPADVGMACRLAEEAFESYSQTSLMQRSGFLHCIADEVERLGDAITERLVAETGLTPERIRSEHARACAQLRLFAGVVAKGLWSQATIDTLHPDRPGAPDLRLQKVAIGPVGIFGSSNFPMLYSVAGGDTAAALAAGCPVVVKAHGAHLGTSELVGSAIQTAVKTMQLHEGVFSLVIGAGNEVGEALVDHPAIKAVTFTGSEGGGMALVRRGQQRPEPIPVFAEMTSVNPHFLLPAALKQRGEEVAAKFVDQMTGGVGQMCLKPGLLLAIEGDDYDRMTAKLVALLANKPSATMLTPNIHAGYLRSVQRQQAGFGVRALASGGSPANPLDGQAILFEVDAKDFLNFPELGLEAFGPAATVVRCTHFDEMVAIAGALRGQLSASLLIDEPDYVLAKRLIPVLERRTGRILVNGFSNVQEIGYATVHGGPFPATSDSRFTSVGFTSMERYLRPVCYQNFPETLLPDTLKDANPLHLSRLVDGEHTY